MPARSKGASYVFAGAGDLPARGHKYKKEHHLFHGSHILARLQQLPGDGVETHEISGKQEFPRLTSFGKLDEML